jgi:AcrR family transcriptional regulator
VSGASGRAAARRRREDGERSRRKILDAATRLATSEGLEGLSIGRLADHIGMSKSGLYAHFGSKEELQLATVDAAAEIFAADVIAPAELAQTPAAKIEALCESFLSHVERRVFPGGCFFVSTGSEFATRPGAVKERIGRFQREWMELLVRLLREAQAIGELRSEDPEQVAFELEGYLLMANAAFLEFDDAGAIGRARRAVTARLAASRPVAGA